MRNKLIIRATMTAPNEIFLQFTNEDGESIHRAGSLVMTPHHYRSFINALMTGSLASGDAGCEVKLTEEGFDQWSSNKKEEVK